MVEATKLSVKTEQKTPDQAATPQVWQPFQALRNEIDRLFHEFERGSLFRPLGRSPFDLESLWRGGLATAPAVDIVENANAFELTADLPGLDEKNIEIKVANGGLTIKGEKQEEKEEKQKDYYLQERHFGSFERSFRIPEGVEADKIEATFKKGVLTVTLPKKPEAQQAPKKIEVKAA